MNNLKYTIRSLLLRPAVYAIDKDQPVGTIQPLEEILGTTMAKQRFGMVLLLVFSFVALVIAAVGIYGVMAYSVAQRTGEFGIRMALGAQRSDVLRLVLSSAGKLVGSDCSSASARPSSSLA